MAKMKVEDRLKVQLYIEIETRLRVNIGCLHAGSL